MNETMMKSYECTVAPGAADPSGLATVPSICGCIFRAIRKDLFEKSFKSLQAPATGYLPYKWILQRSEIKIDERPRRGDMFNILVSSEPENAVNENVTSFNKVVLLTDSEGVEIGRGRTCWILAQEVSEASERPVNDLLNPKIDCRTTVLSPRQPEDLSEQPCQRHEVFTEQPEQFLRSFFSLLPEGSISSGLQTRIDLDFGALPVASPVTPSQSYFGFPAETGDEMTFNVRKDYDDRYTFIARSGCTTLFRALLQTA